ncbi:heterokaryon incompatibility protein-domain-containing protein [Hypomontagnella monticulosa]|nr:heterokaryon incompatibility protein-domain-containing protein [Hypomontagnella monticulosa]
MIRWYWGDNYRAEWESELSERGIRRCYEINNPDEVDSSKRSKRTEDPQLCLRCRYIDWAKLATLEVPTCIGIPIARIEQSRRQLQASDCDLCRILASDTLFPEDESPDVPVGQLIARSSAFINLRDMVGLRPKLEYRSVKDTVGISLQGSYRAGMRICIGGFVESEIGTVLRPVEVDLTIVQDWLQSCRVNHPDTCPTAEAPGLLESPVLQRLRVLDCHSKTVVRKPRSSMYVALSYVWGKTQDNTCYPRVVEDSMAVCIALGYQYLWVDRYCIDQSDARDKHEQISAMDLIYGSADMVIIAAAGDDAHYGLPGLGSRKRIPQQSMQIGDVQLIEIFNTRQRLRQTVWWTRGWTFQESLLARRKLIFTEQEVYFQCRYSYCFESFHVPKSLGGLLGSHTPGYSGGDAIVSLSPLTSFIPGDASLEQLEDQLIQYTNKSLSFESDRLNAFLGVLNASKIAHIWGIPVLVDADQWYGSSLDIIFLGWRSLNTGQRNNMFPSWSWAGWTGTIENIGPGAWSYCCSNDGTSTLERGDEIRYINMSVEVNPASSNGAAMPQQVSVHRFIADFASGVYYTRTSHILEVEAPTIWVKLTLLDITQEDQGLFLHQTYWYVNLCVSHRESARFQLARTDVNQEIDTEETYLMVVLPSADFEHYMLLLVYRSDHYERLGILELVEHVKHEGPNYSELIEREDATSHLHASRSNPLWAQDIVRRKFRLG